MKNARSLVLIILFVVFSWLSINAQALNSDELAYKEIKFKLHEDFLQEQSFDEIAENLTNYVDDINTIFAKTTKRRFYFKPYEGGLVFEKFDISSGQCNTSKLNIDHSYTAEITKSDRNISYGGQAACDYYGENTLYAIGMKWKRIYSRSEIEDDYFTRQLNTIIHELGHLHGLALGEYYSLGSMNDYNLPDFSISRNNPEDYYWSHRAQVLLDPMMGSDAEGHQYIDLAKFSSLSSKIINDSASQTKWTRSYTNFYLIDYFYDTVGKKIDRELDINIKVLDLNTNTPIENCLVDVYNAGSHKVGEKIYSGFTDNSGKYTLKNKISHGSAEIMNVFKVYCDGYEPAGDALSVFDLQAFLFNQGGSIGDFHYDGELEIYARRLNIDKKVTITSPQANSFLAQSQVVFEWEPILGISSYLVNLEKIYPWPGAIVTNKNVVSNTYIAPRILSPGKYRFSVKSVEEGVISPVSTINFYIYDPLANPPSPAIINSHMPNSDNLYLVQKSQPKVLWSSSSADIVFYELTVVSDLGERILSNYLTNKPEYLIDSFPLNRKYSLLIRTFNKAGRYADAEFEVMLVKGVPVGNFNFANLPEKIPGLQHRILEKGSDIIWTQSTNATIYSIRIKDFITSNSLVQKKQADTKLTLPDDLIVGAEFQFSVSAGNLFSSITKDFSFMLADAVSELPQAPTGLVPVNNSVLTNTKPELKWDAVSGAIRYEITLDKMSSAATVEKTIVDKALIRTNSYIPTEELQLLGNYRLRLRALNAKGFGPISEIQFLITNAPPAVTNIKIDNKIAQDSVHAIGIKPSLSWQASAGAVGYDLVIKDASGNAKLTQNNYLGTSLASTTSLVAGNYSLTITPYILVNSSQKIYGLANIVNFSVINKPGSFKLNKPTALNSSRPSFSWTASANAVEYEVEIKQAGTVVYSLSKIKDTYLNLDRDLIDGTYSIQVKAVNGIGSIAVTGSFRLSIAPSAVTSLESSFDEATRKISIIWNSVIGASKYEISVYNVCTGKSLFIAPISVNAPATHVTTDALSSSTGGGQYRVKIVAKNSSGLTSSETVLDQSIFVYSSIGPGLRVTAPIANQILKSGTNQTFRWLHANGAAGYRVRIEDLRGLTIADFGNIRVDALRYTTTLPNFAKGSYRFVVIPIDGRGNDVITKKVGQIFKI